jgi:sugar phosphate isomerase/epimerase
MKTPVSRRQMLAVASATLASSTALHAFGKAVLDEKFAFKYLVGSCMYGYLYLGEILPEVAKCGATHIDIWPKRHGNQREQLSDMGEELFLSLLKKHNVSLGCMTQYVLGPFGLQDEMKVAQRLGCQTIVTGGSGPKGLTGTALKAAVKEFLEKMNPHLDVAEETGITIAIENHANNLIDSPDSLKYLAELSPSPHLAVAFAPYHLPQDSIALAQLIRDLGNSIRVFYAWEHGDGCMTRLPKNQELKQMPANGPLDFQPLVQALVDIDYSGWTEIFMHPVPRGIPILETAEEVTAEINKSRHYLSEKLAATTR